MNTGQAIPLEGMTLIVGNRTLVCQIPYRTTSKGIWLHDNPLYFSAPLLMLQLSVISLISQAIDFCLKPLGQSRIVSQIVGGIILGPSLLGHEKTFAGKLFPPRGTLVLETFATFGLMFFLFLIGVKMDPSIIRKSGRMAMTIGLSVFFFSLALPTSLSLILKTYIPMETTLQEALPFIAASQSLTAFPVIACLLTELKILNTDLGRLAVSSAMVADVIGITLTAIGFSTSNNKDGQVLTSVWGILTSVAMVTCIVFVIRPAMLWVMKQTPEGKSVQEVHLFAIFVSVLGAGFVSEAIGQHFVLGPLILGLAAPPGPPLGSALVEKLETFVEGLLYPTFLAVSGLKTNMFAIRMQSSWIVGFIVISACLVKIAAVMLPSLYCKMPMRDALVLGLVLNAKGIVELIVYNLWKDDKTLGEQEFALAVLSVVAATAIVAPLVRILYDDSKRYTPIRRRTIQDAKREAEFRILVCIHNQESVPTMVNLLEVSNATRESPISVVTLQLVELVGRASPILIAHQHQRSVSSNSSRSDHVINAFRHYEMNNQGAVIVQPFTAIAHFATMHDDICQLALDKRVTLVIIPFHKQWAIDGSVGSVNGPIRCVNLNVLDKAPCSVGILVDRGILNGAISTQSSRSLYRVVVIFIGGPDDNEALAYGARMAQHATVNLTVIRFLLLGNDNARDRKLDSDAIYEIRYRNVDCEGFVYKEEVVRNGEGLAAVIRGMEDGYDLMIVGRHHRNECPLLAGLTEWSECPELGIIGDMLAAPDFGGTASVLVVQQQAKVGQNMIACTIQPGPGSNLRDPLVHDVPDDDDEDHNATWAISVDRSDKV